MFDIQQELKKLPDKPGVYIMRDKTDNIIYIGKAIVLKNRVRQYFQSSANHTPKVLAMVSNIQSFEYIVTDSELEALILECNLIKKHRPKYNILLKDDKHYPYIKVTMTEDYPRVIMTRKLEKDGSKYFGPYSSSFAIKEALDLLKRLLPLKTCKRVFPRDIGKQRPCLNFYIQQCIGPCTGKVSVEEYKSLMKDVCDFLAGKQEMVLGKLGDKMKKASMNLEFEKAASYRDKIKNIKTLSEKQKVLSTDMEDQDVIACVKGSNDACIEIFFVRGGKLIGRENFVFEGQADNESKEILSSFIKQFYIDKEFIPDEILLDDEIEDLEVVQKWLANKKGRKIEIKIPKRGEKLKLLEMVMNNAKITLSNFEERVSRESSITNEGLIAMTELLGLEKLPRRIEAFDISNTGSSEIVASMVVFENGKANNSQYRRFKIKSVTGQNDYASMQETVFRRLKHAKRDKEENVQDSGFSKLPDLIFLDGGIGHVNAVSQVLDELSMNIPVFGMVKNDKHRTRGIVSSGNEFDLSGNLTILRFVTAIQDEAHRFAIEYNRKLRTKRYLKSELDEIEGIGPARKKLLLKHFGSLNKIKRATKEEISSVEGISEALAKSIYDFFRIDF